MRAFVLSMMCLLFSGCCSTCERANNGSQVKESYYVPEVIEEQYVPQRSNRVFHKAGFDIKEGQQMRDFFDDFEEPMHTYYSGDNVEWTYYVDYDAAHDKGKIVRYCDLKNYAPRSLCAMKVSFYLTYVNGASTNCY